MMLRALFLFSFLSFASLPAVADPSSRVGRIASIQGAVTLLHSSDGDAQLATVNWPITADNELITDSISRAEIRLGAAAIRLGPNTDLSITRLDDSLVQLRLNRGSIQLHIRSTSLARELELAIPQGHVFFYEPANVRVDTRDDNNVSAINVASGVANFDGGATHFSITAGRRAEVDSGGLRTMESRNNFRDDAFDAWNAERDSRNEQALSPRYVSSDMTGYEVLESYGGWRTTTTYGPIWSPTFIPVGWAPYRDGRWTWIAPWGWTWVDNAPWGYAPSHYGRWVFYEQRWCWTPGVYSSRPVWAPALVGWVDGSGWQYANDRGGPAVGWFPLAPREVYVPAYPVTPRYLQLVNNGYAINSNAALQIGGNTDPRNTVYQNQLVRNAVTVLPSYQFGSSKTVVVRPSSLLGNQAQMVRNTTALAVAPATVKAPLALPAPVQAYQQVRPQSLPAPDIGSYRGGTSTTSSSQSTAPSMARQSQRSAMLTVVVRPADVSPLVTAPPVQHGSLAASGIAPVPAQQRLVESTKAPPDQRRRVLTSGSNLRDSSAASEGSGRVSLQR